LTAAVISLTSRVASTAITHPVGAMVPAAAGTTFLAVWRENYAWMLVNFLATSVNGASLAIAYQALGFFGAATFVLPLGVAWYSFRLYVERSMEVRRRNDELQALNERLRTANESLERSTLSVIESLVSALEAKGEAAHGHSAATTARAAATARRMGLSEEDIAAIHIGAMIHDVGKIGVAPEILRKPAALSVEEWHQMRQHPVLGAQILAQVPALESARPIVLAHHERYDGTGYPRGLRGSEIPLAAQIVSVADAFDAMTSPRPYRAPLSVQDAARELRAGSGTQFNPAVVEAFLVLIAESADTQIPVQGHARSAPLPAR
jgi:HD-GYP domain-containing protein (c-di-GMP phosphodiesterase class II)